MDELDSWPTKRLLGRLNALRRCEESPSHSDFNFDLRDPDTHIFFKSDPKWKVAYQQVKSLLDNREHVVRGKAARQARAKAGK